jgi:hypothetical protein
MKQRGKKLFCLFIVALLAAPLAADTPEYQRYRWETNPKLDTLTAAEKKEGAVIMLDKRVVEMIFDYGDDGYGPATPLVYQSRHMIIRLNTDFAISYYNKVYVPMTNVLGMMEFEARFISKDGKVHEMDTRNVKDVPNYNNSGPYKIYALEGIEIGGQIEYVYTVKKAFRAFGTESYRSIYNYRSIELDIYSPENIEYDAKSYNSLSEIEQADYNGRGNKSCLHMHTTDVQGYEDEPYSSSEASYPRVEYKFCRNTAYGLSKRLNTWDDAAKLFYTAIYSLSSADYSRARTEVRRAGAHDKSMPEEDRIRAIENYVKATYSIRSEAEGAKYEKISGIIVSKVATDLGIMRLYAAMFQQAGIAMEIVMTSDRFQKRFDGDFDSWTYLQYFLIYFPETQSFLAPSAPESRYGFIPSELCGQDGMFIRKSDLGSDGMRGVIKWIQETSWDKNMSTLNVHVTFDLSKGTADVKSTHAYTGHSASFIQPYMEYMSSEDAVEAAEGILRTGAFEARPRNLVYTGYKGNEALYREAFTVSGDFTTNAFLERTCDAYIFKIGEIIGTQYNLYEKEERRTDVTLNYPHGMRREIAFEIPEGYKVTNLNALNIDVRNDSADASMIFRSSYEQSGNTVTVLIEESYHEIKYPVAMYDDFSAVMNASADFNKVVLFFEKK